MRLSIFLLIFSLFFNLRLFSMEPRPEEHTDSYGTGESDRHNNSDNSSEHKNPKIPEKTSQASSDVTSTSGTKQIKPSSGAAVKPEVAKNDGLELSDSSSSTSNVPLADSKDNNSKAGDKKSSQDSTGSLDSAFDQGTQDKDSNKPLKSVEKGIMASISDWFSDFFGSGDVANAKKKMLASTDVDNVVDALAPLSASQRETVLNHWLDAVKSDKGSIDLKNNKKAVSDLLYKLNPLLPDSEKVILMRSDDNYVKSSLYIKVCSQEEMNSIISANENRPHAYASKHESTYGSYLDPSSINNSYSGHN